MIIKREYKNKTYFVSIWEDGKCLWSDPHGWSDASDAYAEACDKKAQIFRMREEAAIKQADNSYRSSSL